jgi:hypothetical protein
MCSNVENLKNMNVTEWLKFKVSLQLWKASGESMDDNGV